MSRNLEALTSQNPPGPIGLFFKKIWKQNSRKQKDEERKKEIIKNLKSCLHGYYIDKYDIRLHLKSYMYRENLCGQNLMQGHEHSPDVAQYLHEMWADFLIIMLHKIVTVLSFN
jgi:hypothetical protein